MYFGKQTKRAHTLLLDSVMTRTLIHLYSKQCCFGLKLQLHTPPARMCVLRGQPSLSDEGWTALIWDNVNVTEQTGDMYTVYFSMYKWGSSCMATISVHSNQATVKGLDLMPTHMLKKLLSLNFQNNVMYINKDLKRKCSNACLWKLPSGYWHLSINGTT